MLPALERCSVILSRLWGIAKFQGSNNTVGFSSHQISLLMDTVACLHLVCSKILVQAVDELELFKFFSTWLRHEIDRLASDSTVTMEDAADKEATINHARVLIYLRTCIPESPLVTFFGNGSEDCKNDWTDAQQGLPIFEILDKELQKQEKGLPYLKGLPHVDLIIDQLSRQASAVFSQVAIAEKRNVLFGREIKFGAVHSNTAMDMRMCRMVSASGLMWSISLTRVCRQRQSALLMSHSYQKVTRAEVGYNRSSSLTLQLTFLVFIAQILLSIENGISTTQHVESAAVQLGSGEVKDMRFLDDDILLVLWDSDGKSSPCSSFPPNSHTGTTNLLRVPYSHSAQRSASPGLYCMKYAPHKADVSSRLLAELKNDEVLSRFARYEVVDKDSDFVPEKIDTRRTNGKDMKQGSERLFILGRGGLQYKVCALPGSDHQPATMTRTTVEDVEDVVMSQ